MSTPPSSSYEQEDCECTFSLPSDTETEDLGILTLHLMQENVSKAWPILQRCEKLFSKQNETNKQKIEFAVPQCSSA